jgi:hypothetical protein
MTHNFSGIRANRIALLGYLLAVLALAVMVPFASAQNMNKGEIRGEVRDTSGAVVPGVEVVIRNVNTGITQTTHTDAVGVYDAPFVSVGSYSITFRKEGFKTSVRSGVNVDIGITVADSTLEVGAVATNVTVQAQLATVQTESSDRNTVVPGATIAVLPNIAQDWTTFTALLPGAARAGPAYSEFVTTSSSGAVLGAGGYLAFNGSMPWQENFTVDGGMAWYPHSQNLNMAYDMPIDTVQETTAVTNNYSAQYTSGIANISVITKSGTNQFHGSLFEFVQNSAMMSRNFFTLPTAANPQGKVAPLHWNKFGGNVGGPIKRDKAFFFFSFMSNPMVRGQPSLYTMPTVQATEGNFSASGYPTVYDPTTTTLINGVETRTSFLSETGVNAIPTAMMDPVALKIQSYYPPPNLAGLVNNFAAAPEYVWYQKWYEPKIDYNFSERHRLSYSGAFNAGGVTNNGVIPQATMDQNSTRTLTGFKQNNTTAGNGDERHTLSDNWIFSPRLGGEFHSTMDRWVALQSGWAAGKGYPAQLGLLNAPADNFPSINATGSLPVSVSGNSGSVLEEGSYSQSAVLSYIRGKHLIRFGGEYNRFYTGEIAALANAGSFTFNGIATRNPATGSSGLGYADFLLGMPQSWSATEYPMVEVRSNPGGLFFQDDYKIRSNLTLNFGLRLTLQQGWYERHNMIGDFDPTLTNPATNTLGAVWYADGSAAGGRRLLQNSDYNNWAPRLGFAWSPKKNWAVRGAWGVFDLMWGDGDYTGGAVGLGSDRFNSLTSSDNLTPVLQLSKGEPNLFNSLPPSNLTPSFNNNQNIYYYPRYEAMPYMQQAHLDVQHEFAGFIADVGYVWTKGTHLFFATDMNQVPASRLAAGNAQPNRPYPQFLNITAIEHDGLSKYDALQATLKRQFGNKQFTLIANYTYCKTMDTGTSTGWSNGTIDTWQIAHNLQANYGLSTYDIRQTGTGGFVYELPVGRGRAFVNRGGVSNAVIGGWELSAMYDLHTGTPGTPIMATNLSGDMVGSWFPNRIASGKIANPSILKWFDTSAFVQPTSYTFGNSGRDVVTLPGFKDMDISLQKGFPLHWLGEGGRFTIRVDAQNVTNHPNFYGPNFNIGSLAAGTITTAYPGRDIQLGAKLNF